jgi:hypothetical protein
MERRASSPAGTSSMRTVGLHATVVLAVWVTIGCCSGVHTETLSTTKATWEGKAGTAVTITQSDGTQELEGAKSVSFEFCGWRSGSGFEAPMWMLR